MVPATVGRLDVDDLRALFLFESLDQDQLAWLAREGEVVDLPPGVVFAEGSTGTHCYVLISGSIRIAKRSGTQDITLNRTDRPGVYSGALAGFYGDPLPQPYLSTMWAVAPSRFFVIAVETMATMMRTWFPMAVHVIQGTVSGMRATFANLGERDRLLGLGALAAGLTHELNNPAAAGLAAAAALRERYAAGERALAAITGPGGDPALLPALLQLAATARRRAAAPPPRSPIETGDAEDALADRLSGLGVAEAWDIAPALVSAGLDPAELDRLRGLAGSRLPAALCWLASALDAEALLTEATEAANRVSALVASVGTYAQLDQAPQQPTAVNELLEAALAVLAPRLTGIEVRVDLAADLPRISAGAGELNEVWTELIDNAAAAMGGAGTLTVRSRRADGGVTVAISDTGHGVPPEYRSRIFDPFFTTRPIGAGKGLGLDLVRRVVVERHHGDVRLASADPGDTCFAVWLPCNPTTVSR